MDTGNRRVGPATLRIRRSNALPLHMRAQTREVVSVHVPSAQQGRGYATTLMHQVCREADAAGLVLVLWPQPFGDDIAMGRGQLAEWYAKSFGFMQIQADPPLMARMPGSSPRLLKLNPVIEALQA